MKQLVSRSGATVAPITSQFAWDGRVPLNAVTVLAGPPGQGKTQLLIGACSRATRGKLPGDLEGKPADTLYVSAEDSLEHTLVPRLLAAGGDPSRVHFFDVMKMDARPGNERTTFQIPDDIPELASWLDEHPETRIIVLDPIVAMMAVTLNAHRDQHVRRALAPLAYLANERSIAVIAVMHLNKDREADPLNRLSGSIGFGGAARSVLLFTQDPDDPDGENGNQRVLAHVKCNVGRQQPSIGYRIEPRTIETARGEVATSIATRTGNLAVSASDLLTGPTSSGEATARGEARDFLMAELADGPVPTVDLKNRAHDAGLSWPTVERAKKQLNNVRARKNGTSWQWELLITPLDGVDVVDGVERKAIKAINSVSDNEVTVFDPDAELARAEAKLTTDNGNGSHPEPTFSSLPQGIPS